jgi:hypothetical protein
MDKGSTGRTRKSSLHFTGKTGEVLSFLLNLQSRLPQHDGDFVAAMEDAYSADGQGV